MEELEKVILYLDCDGVIFDTINAAFRLMKKEGIDIHNHHQVNYFFIHFIDWNQLFEDAGIINGAREKINNIVESRIFKEVVILTKLSGSYHEERIKRGILNELFPSIRIITLDYSLSKSGVVLAEGNILVDDEEKNILSWRNAHGIGIHFIQGLTDLPNDIISDLLSICDTNSVKKLVKQSKN